MNKKKVLVTGLNGLLGSSIKKYLLSYDIIECNDLDISNFKDVSIRFKKSKPDIVIHTAAYTDVDGCEKNPEKAFLVNTIGTQNLVNCCIGKDILFIYISSTGIYGTEKDSRYIEFDDVLPTTVHHKTKYEAEKVVKTHLNKYLILRTGWLYGGTTEHKKNFVYKRYLEALGSDKIYSDDSQIGNPTSVIEFVKQIEVLIENNQYGVFNCVNSAINISRYDYVKEIIKQFEVSCDVKIAKSDIYKRLAPVSKNESAQNYKLDLLSLNIMSDWKDALSDYILKLKSEL